ncbi:uncharacterized protein THITE_2126654 [Thermothielavioides terrestris NRRL 8126]|uniref:Uncharacterized protein n=1 Tax=Thermothielavioides terrestris (strain ATCC 38088 / NRRL 8126) TaxID=578455 RepID=G2QS99_THETT|nr:uncharacterized protein THITE_2126654 [Thermothielavioides terrestris NRRL 8126]AEO64288.1 hypothetical protein THITE_2126654 [Thermothielavioides terrestris NRRL 8126]
MARRFLLSLLIGIVSLGMTLAAPTVYPEVIPGPGLPTLAELNLTTAQLYELGRPNTTALLRHGVTLSPRWEGRCGPEDGAYAKVDDVIACFHYLLSLDTRPCRSIHYPNNNRLCQAGGAQIFVFTTNIKHADSDVARGALWVIDHCTRPDMTSAGWQAAYGNGFLIVNVANLGWFNDPDWTR